MDLALESKDSIEKKLDRLMELDGMIARMGRNFDALSQVLLKEIEPRLRLLRDTYYAERQPLSDEWNALQEEIHQAVLKGKVNIQSASGKYIAKLNPATTQWDLGKLDFAKTAIEFEYAKINNDPVVSFEPIK